MQRTLIKPLSRTLTTSSVHRSKESFQIVVVGGGAGGCSMASKFASSSSVTIIEPSMFHYYQPMWTLVGAGLKSYSNSVKSMASVLPSDANWIQSKVSSFHPESNCVSLEDGRKISYDILIIAMGLQCNYSQIEGLEEALQTNFVGSNYSPKYVQNTWRALQNFKSGNAIFTFPNSPVKCAGAPQKIMYLTERILKSQGKNPNVMYHTPLSVLFGVEKYAKSLWEIVQSRNIDVHLKSNLIQILPQKRIAVFQNMESKKESFLPYEMLHVTPPMGPPKELSTSSSLVDSSGFLNVNSKTLQHVNYDNIFGIGDCTNVPNAKTAAAVAAQVGILKRNLRAFMAGQSLKASYDGYASCPLVTGPGECILAEFDFSSPPKPLETFPWNQAKRSRVMYELKAHVMPHIYYLMLKGYWEGPRIFRKIMHLGMSR